MIKLKTKAPGDTINEMKELSMLLTSGLKMKRTSRTFIKIQRVNQETLYKIFISHRFKGEFSS